MLSKNGANISTVFIKIQNVIFWAIFVMNFSKFEYKVVALKFTTSQDIA